jgi:hypothetical protein
MRGPKPQSSQTVYPVEPMPQNGTSNRKYMPGKGGYRGRRDARWKSRNHSGPRDQSQQAPGPQQQNSAQQ